MRADIHYGQELNGSINRPDTEAQDQPSPNHHFRLATRGRSIQMGHKRTYAAQQKDRYSITSSARPSSNGGTSRSNALAVLKLMFGALIRAAERWKSIKVTEFERRQLAAVKKELDQEYEVQVDLNRKPSKAAAHTKISSSSQT
jgi:hypothetical protein